MPTNILYIIKLTLTPSFICNLCIVISDINSKYFYRRKMQKYVKILCNHMRVICKSKIVIGAIIIQCTLRLLRYPDLYHWTHSKLVSRLKNFQNSKTQKKCVKVITSRPVIV